MHVLRCIFSVQGCNASMPLGFGFLLLLLPFCDGVLTNEQFLESMLLDRNAEVVMCCGLFSKNILLYFSIIPLVYIESCFTSLLTNLSNRKLCHCRSSFRRSALEVILISERGLSVFGIVFLSLLFLEGWQENQ